MGGRGRNESWVRAHLATLVRVSLLLACAFVLAILVQDLRGQQSDAALDEAAADANSLAKWNAVRLAWNRHQQAHAGEDAQKLVDALVWQPSPSALEMIAIARTSAGSRYIVAFTRKSLRQRWRLVSQVDLIRWPWDEPASRAEDRRIPFPPAFSLRALQAGRPIPHSVVAVPVMWGRTIICARFRDGTGQPPNPICIGVYDEQPERPYVLGRSR
jgi:hypothetical protein